MIKIEAAGVATSQSGATNRTKLIAALDGSTNAYYFSGGDYQISNAAGLLQFNNFRGRLVFSPNSRLVLSTNTQPGFFFSGGGGAQFYNVSVAYSALPTVRGGGEAFLLQGTTATYVENYSITGSTQMGMLFSACTRPRVEGFYALNTMADGLHFDNCQDPQGSMIVTDNTGDDGLAVVNVAAGALTTGGQFDRVTVKNSSARGIIALQSGVTVTNFYIDTTTYAGLFCAYDPVFVTRVPSDVLFAGGTVINGGTKSNSWYGVEYSEVDAVAFENVFVRNPGASGFYGRTTNGVVTLIGCRAQATPGAGYDLGAKELEIMAIKAKTTNSYGAYLFGSDAVIAEGITAIDTSKTSGLHRAVAFENNTHVVASDLKVIDTKATPTGYIVGAYGTQDGILGDVMGHVPSGTFSVENNSALARGQTITG